MLASKTAHERDRSLPIDPRPPSREKQRNGQVQRRGKAGGRKAEHTGLVKAQPAPIQQLVIRTGAVYGADQRQCLCIRTEQDVLAIVDGDAVGFDATRASAECARGFEHGDRAPRGG